MKNLIYIIFGIALIGSLSGCDDLSESNTTLEIIDNNRHYYPVLRGQELNVIFTLKNTGTKPFVLNDMLITCGCIVPKKSSIRSIPAGREGKLHLIYNSNKNIGFVEHHIDIYGNLKEDEKITLVFDVNVVPEGLYTKDYEEVYKEARKEAGIDVKEMVDGDESNKGFYLDEDF
ncbi:DUF1573 domain-containing protein [Brumimicrobium glaciale]|uniref:DUF1573 domain-containing protein n=1 Tax=Brumimicrobium glaciale TaxID=200475 RepID=A0A4Q4KQZ2_9FLAO|nr:DUF1573 domain-containing protein [Brumimicrobium glaciale]RYM36058.1 DUF1573 domain-containing protein [Brumimicrobium glaciale]